LKVLKSAALVAAALLGAMALAAPASADPPPFTADASCGADGTWQVRWYYYNIEGGLPERYDPLGTTITTDPPGTKLELTGDIATRTADGSISGYRGANGETLGIPTSVESVTLTLSTISQRTGRQHLSELTVGNPGGCAPATPPTTAPTNAPTTKPTHSAAPAPVPSSSLSASASGGGGGLPVTGAAAGSIAAGAVVLLVAGGVLFLMARRRRVKFSA